MLKDLMAKHEGLWKALGPGEIKVMNWNVRRREGVICQVAMLQGSMASMEVRTIGGRVVI